MEIAKANIRLIQSEFNPNLLRFGAIDRPARFAIPVPSLFGNPHMNAPSSDAPSSNKAWFAPKQFGYGAGLPIAWQGWAMLAVHVAVIGIGSALMHRLHTAQTLWVIGTVLLPLPLYAAKTQGGWKWRWGSKAR